MSPCSVIGIDVGGTKIAVGTLELPAGRWRPYRTAPTRRDRGPQVVLDDVLQLTRDLASSGALAGRPVAAIGVGLCELVGRSGTPLSGHCIDWQGLPVLEELAQIAPAFFEADVRAAAQAEALFGAGVGLASFLYITVGTGISCCLMVEGRPHLGTHGMTGTMASSPLGSLLGIPDGGPGMTLEDLASGPALVARFRKSGGVADRGEEILRAALEGHPIATEIVRSGATALGAHIGLLVNVLDPAAVVVGGGLGSSTGPYWDALTVATRSQIWSDTHRTLPLLQASTGVDAGWLGAAIAALDRFGLPRPDLSAPPFSS
jgi:predicted NBD/HSP70 family sugar kinase